MPVSVSTLNDPFRTTPAPQSESLKEHELRVPQARLLRALMPAVPSDPPIEWPVLNRSALGVQAGYTAISGSVSRALGGISASNKTSGDPHPGLLKLGFVESFELDIDGLTELNYRITAAGIRAYQSFLAQGGKLPPLKAATSCTNLRYAKETTDAGQ